MSFDLIKKREFGPIFGTQFFGAFNDNFFKNALVILIAYNASKGDAIFLVNIAAGLFILPFFLFSAIAGQITDKLEKSWIIRRVKILEIIIMSLAIIGFLIDHHVFLILVLFLMGTQSAFFGPVKYSILPQHLKPEELIGGNAFVEMGTFLAILLGTMFGGILISIKPNGHIYVSITLLVIAILGWLTSRKIPIAPANDPNLKIKYNPIIETYRNMKDVTNNKFVFIAVLSISWFWFFGFFYLAQFPSYAKEVLHGNEQIVILLLTMFSIGIGFGSYACERFSNKIIELGLVPIGAIGLSLFSIDLYFAKNVIIESSNEIGAIMFLKDWNNIRILIDLTMIGVSGGFFIVPLYAAIQERGDTDRLSRQIASNNIYNALFMVVAAVFAMILVSINVTIPEMFLIVAIMNLVIVIALFIVVPEFLIKFLIWIKARLNNKKVKDVILESNDYYLDFSEDKFNSIFAVSKTRKKAVFIFENGAINNLIYRFIIFIGKVGDDYIMVEEIFDEDYIRSFFKKHKTHFRTYLLSEDRYNKISNLI